VQKDRVILKVAENVKIEYQKSAIVAVLDEKATASAKGDDSE
jgi:preprotein translocase subunit YajC